MRNLPPTPGLISGPTNACEFLMPGGVNALYTIRKVNGATSYSWTAPPGSIVLHPNATGVNDTAILVRFHHDFNNGAISVTASNGCGTSAAPRNLAVGKLRPATPGVIDVLQIAACPNRQYTYTIAGLPSNATSIVWTVPAQAIGFTGQGTTSITVDYPSIAINGSVTATAYSNCSNSVTRASVVKLAACPVEPPPAPFSGENNHPLGRGVTVQPETVNLEAIIYPNPSTSGFNLQVLSAGKEQVKIRIMDLQGRTFKQINVAPYQQTSIGNELKAGTYIVEIIQGKDRITQKIVKL